MEHPILNPRNPYVGTLRIFPGTLVKVAGRATPNATRFAINFQTGPSINPRDDLALHLSPCFTPPRIIRNSLINGSWGVEEAWSSGAILSPHAPFEIMILAEQDQFKIAVNGAHYCEFRHRIPYQQITHLSVDGDVDIERISIVSDSHGSQPAYRPAGMPSAPPPQSAAPYPSNPGAGMPMPSPSMYPNLGPNPMPSHYPAAPAPSMPAGPAPAPATYASGYPSAYPPQGPGPYPTPSAYPQVPPGAGPAPAPSGYQQGYPVSDPKDANFQLRRPICLARAESSCVLV